MVSVAFPKRSINWFHSVLTLNDFSFLGQIKLKNERINIE